MSKKRINNNLLVGVRIFMLVAMMFFLVMAISENIIIHGKVIEYDISSNVSIMKSIAISFSSTLAAGIEFSEINFLPAGNVNASGNYAGGGNTTLYFVEVSTDGNSAMDLCIRADGNLTNSGGDEINIQNETYSAFIEGNNLTIPSLANETSLDVNYTLVASNIGLGERGYLRFWLDVPSGQPSGHYNNSIYFNGVPAGDNCL